MPRRFSHDKPFDSGSRREEALAYVGRMENEPPYVGCYEAQADRIVTCQRYFTMLLQKFSIRSKPF